MDYKGFNIAVHEMGHNVEQVISLNDIDHTLLEGVPNTAFTEAINHDPAMTLLQTGHQITGRPSMGAWLSYGLGSENDNLPAYVVMISRPTVSCPEA